MLTAFVIQKASIVDSRRILVEGIVRSGEVTPGQRTFVKKRKFIVDALPEAEEQEEKIMLRTGAYSTIVLRSVIPIPFPSNFLRGVQGEIITLAS